MSTTVNRPLRIGEVAELTGVTPRTIRYYEEIGLLPARTPREQGKHRCYGEGDVTRIREIVRLRDLLGLSLEQLSERAIGDLDIQLRLVRERREDLDRLERELLERRDRPTEHDQGPNPGA